MTENPSRRDSDLHEEIPRKTLPLEPRKAQPLEEKTEAELKGIERRKKFKRLKKPIHINKKSLLHIFGTTEWFFVFFELFVLFIIFLILIVPYSWLYFYMGIQFPLRQLFYIWSSIITVIGIVGIFHYFFPEWYVE
jgi:hypothetical protein